MKKWIMIAGLLVLTLPVTIQAQDFTCTTNIDNTLTITGYNGSGGDVAIPDALNTLSVTCIGEYAFGCRTNLTSVTISGSVTNIGRYAFSECTSLTNAITGNNVTGIDNFAFERCTSLKTVTIPDSLTYLGAYVFSACTNLMAFTVGVSNSAYSSVDGVLFNKNQTLLIQYPSSKISNYTIPESVTRIEYNAFCDGSGLASITIPGNVTNIPSLAFQNCFGLTTVTVASLNTTYSSLDGVLFNKSQTDLIYCPEGKTGNYTIPNTVTKINDAFSSCRHLTSVTIPSSVISLSEGFVFEYCTDLITITVDDLNPVYSSLNGVLFNKTKTTLLQCPGGKTGSYTIPSSVTNIGKSAFSACSLNTVLIPESVGSIGDGAFYFSGLTAVTIPDSVTCLGGHAFSWCNSLTNVVIGNGITNIGYSMFFNCTNLTDVIIGNSVTGIGQGAFNGCIRLTNITIPVGVNNIEDLAFVNSGLTTVTIPNTVTNIGVAAFANCTNLNAVYFDGAAPDIGSYVFDRSENVTIYYLPWTTGWGSSFGERPTALWKPQIQSLNTQTNSFEFNVVWSSGMTVVVEACTNLADDIWIPLETNTLTDSSISFSDPQSTNYPNRYYRVSMPQ